MTHVWPQTHQAVQVTRMIRQLTMVGQEPAERHITQRFAVRLPEN
jgi:hypothetical protein